MLQSLGSKLHILIAIVFFVIAIYLAIIYREIKTLEANIVTIEDLKKKFEHLKKDLDEIDAKLSNTTTSAIVVTAQTGATVAAAPSPIKSSQPVIQPAEANDIDIQIEEQSAAAPPPKTQDVEIDDDDLSVTSNEIKDIITNIRDLPDEDFVEVPAPSASCASVEENEEPSSEKQTMRQEIRSRGLIDLTEEDLSKLKYDDLRSILRKQGLQVKGKREELIEKILALKAEAAQQTNEAKE